MIPDALKSRVYYLLRAILPQEKRSEVKRWFMTGRKRFQRALLLLHGRFTAAELMAELKTRIPADFDILMVHSAYDRLLPMYSGTPADLVNELAAFCGPQRTLAMPAFILGGRDYNPVEYYKTRVFNVSRDVSEVGLPTEVFRRRPGVKRSLHPTHSVCALGPLAEEMTATHHLGTTRAGKHSPFEFMAKKRTVVIGIGVEYYRCLTQAKGVEDLLGDDFPIPARKESVMVRMIDWNRREVPYELTVREFEQPTCGTILRSLLSREELTEWRFRGVPLWRTSAGRVTECLLEAATRGITFYGKVKGRRGGSKPPSGLSSPARTGPESPAPDRKTPVSATPTPSAAQTQT